MSTRGQLPGAVVFAAAALVLSSCTCGGGGGRTECGDFTPAIDAWCAALERCPESFPTAVRDRAECVDLGCFLFTCKVRHDDAREAHRDTVAQVIPTRNAARVQACAGFLAAASCDELGAGTVAPGACDGLLVANDPAAFGVGNGGQCTVDGCAPGLYCAGATVLRASASVRCETCRPVPGEGEACVEVDGGCAAGLWCQARFSTRTCLAPLADGAACTASLQCESGACDPVAQRCAAKKAEGQLCQRHEECRSGVCDLSASRTCAAGCARGGDCAAGQWCDLTTHACRQPQPDGARCSGDGQCAGKACLPGGVCGAWSAVGAACGAGCGPRGACADGVCVEKQAGGQDCRGADGCLPPFECRDGTCQRMNLACQLATLGQGCRALRVCDESSTCDGADLLCHPRKPTGAACAQTPECAPGLGCIGGACGTPGTAGQGCARSADCADGLGCVADPATLARVCSPAPSGAPCGESAPCPPSHFCGADRRCSPRPLEGQACSVASPCVASAYCEQGTVCRARRGDAQSCGPFVLCRPELRCGDGGVCEPAGQVGAGCSDDGGLTCAPGLTCDGLAVPAVCAAQLGTGQSCTRDAQCESGACAPSFGCLASAACVLAP